MPAALDRFQFAPPPPPGMLRAVGLALIAHVLLMMALGWGVNWKRDPVTLSAEAELWSTLPQQAAPRLVEVPPPPPMPAPLAALPPVATVEPPKPEPAPREAEIAVEREKEKQEQSRRKQLALEREKKREAQKHKQLQAQRELDERRKQELARASAAEDKQRLETAKRLKQETREASRIETQRQANLDRMKGMAQATGAQDATGTAQRPTGKPSDGYAGRISARVKPNIVFRDDVAGNPRADVEVRTSPDGTIIGQRIVKSSGVRRWDEAVLKAVIKTEVLPRDVDGRVPSSLILEFRPKD